MITGRSLFGVLAGAVAAPIVVRSGLIMPVKARAPRYVLDPLDFAPAGLALRGPATWMPMVIGDLITFDDQWYRVSRVLG